MPVESANFIAQMDPTYPLGSEAIGTGDNHLRLIKRSVKQTLPNCNSTVSASSQAINRIASLTADAQTQLNALSSDIASVSAVLQAEIKAVSASLEARALEVSANLAAQKLNISATAVNAILWDGATRYVQTATPATTAGDIWFQPE